jgi:altronate dehydratase
VPIGHKIALKDLKAGDTAIKYGEDIGKIIADIRRAARPHPQLQNQALVRSSPKSPWHRNIPT